MPTELWRGQAPERVYDTPGLSCAEMLRETLRIATLVLRGAHEELSEGGAGPARTSAESVWLAHRAVYYADVLREVLEQYRTMLRYERIVDATRDEPTPSF